MHKEKSKGSENTTQKNPSREQKNEQKWKGKKTNYEIIKKRKVNKDD